MFAGQAREPVFADLETADSGHAERELARALDQAHAPEVAV